jgi:hypothetical protein
MSHSVKNDLLGVIAIGAGFVAVVGFSVFASRQFPAVAHNEALLDSWRCIIATIAIVLMKLLYGSMPRIRVMSLQYRAGGTTDSGQAQLTPMQMTTRLSPMQMTTPLWWRS